jgi:uncharacterized membrane protein YeaQ/YmgE (transglycosylase-associated protein family)
MNWIVWIIFGALAGWIASIITGKNRKMGAIANIVVGIVGAFIGGYIMEFFGAAGVTGFNFYSDIALGRGILHPPPLTMQSQNTSIKSRTFRNVRLLMLSAINFVGSPGNSPIDQRSISK